MEDHLEYVSRHFFFALALISFITFLCFVYSHFVCHPSEVSPLLSHSALINVNKEFDPYRTKIFTMICVHSKSKNWRSTGRVPTRKNVCYSSRTRGLFLCAGKKKLCSTCIREKSVRCPCTRKKLKEWERQIAWEVKRQKVEPFRRY